MGVETMIIGAALGGSLAGVGNIISSQAEARELEREAAGAARQADFIKERSAEQMAKEQRDTALLMGEQKARMAAGGLSIGGSNLELLHNTISESEKTLARIKYETDFQVGELGETMRAKRRQASTRRITGFLGGAGSLVSGGTQAASYGQQTKTKGLGGP